MATDTCGAAFLWAGSHATPCAIALQDLQKLRSEFHAAETAAATAEADLVHEEISNRVLLRLGEWRGFRAMNQ